MPYCDEYLRIIEKLQGKYYQIGEIFFSRAFTSLQYVYCYSIITGIGMA